LASEQTPPRAPRRTILIGVGLAVVLAVGAIVLLRDDDSPSGTGVAGRATQQSDGDVAAPDAPAFRFEAARRLVRTVNVRIGRRDRRTIDRASASAVSVLTDLYVEGFLDPANWTEGTYDDAFRGFAGDARREATARAALLTAGPNAGSRYEAIEPRAGRIVTRVLLDREGRPALLMSVVRFSATGTGERPATLRSFGEFFLERRGGSWRIVSFHVTRRDAAEDAA
jgi:hypothetical protein